MKRRPKADNPWVMFHMGLEFAGAAAILALIGWFIDTKYETGPYGALIGATIGFVGGFYLFIKEALLANKLAMKGYRGGLTGKPSLMRDQGKEKVEREDEKLSEDGLEENEIKDSLEEDEGEPEKREN
ncbi:AtpZ/AtpI family protein [Planctomycetota bacterium]|nr:AtpZ/AtpI family protein [Planctomycetota bacterium]